MAFALLISQNLPHAAEAADDFIARREKILQVSSKQPTARVAAFLEVLSRRNGDEGRDPFLINDHDLNSPIIIDLLGLSSQQLTDSLRELEAAKLLRITDDGKLRLAPTFCAQSRER